MIPFSNKDKKAQTGIIVRQRSSDKESKPTEEDSNLKKHAIRACAMDIIEGVKANDIDKVSEAIQYAFEILDSMPHEEGPHIEPHSYDSQKGK